MDDGRWLPTMPIPVADWFGDARIMLLSPDQRCALMEALMRTWTLNGDGVVCDHLDEQTQIAFHRMWDKVALLQAEALEKYRQKQAQTAAARAAKLAKSGVQPSLLQTSTQGGLQPVLRNRSQGVTIALALASSPNGEEISSGVIAAASMEAFETFWIAYPPRQGVRTGKANARTAWRRHVTEPDVEPIMASVERLKRSKQWREDDGRFVPLAATFLNQRRWEDDNGTASASAGKDYSSWDKQA